MQHGSEHSTGRPARRVAAAAALIISLQGQAHARPQVLPPGAGTLPYLQPIPADEASPSLTLDPEVLTVEGEADPAGNPEGVGEAPAAPKAVATVERSPGDGTVILRGDASTGGELRYRWTQTRGTPVALSDPSSPVARFAIPTEPGAAEFLLSVGNEGGVDTTRVEVSFVDASDPGSALRADAGDDQISSVGKQVTLNGIRSEPREGVGYRWIQVGGPPVELKIEDRYVFTFIPRESGVYRFALVIASDNVISRPDTVDVTVLAHAPTIQGGGQPTASTEDLARQALVRVEGGYTAAPLLAETFASIADRVSLYGSYSELTAELTRRLDEVVPRDPVHRAGWNQHVFSPLTVRLIERLRTTGLDLLQPGATEAPLLEPQREVLAGELRRMADGFETLQPGP